MRFNVAIVDDDATISATLEQAIAESREFRCVGTYCNVSCAMRYIPATKPDIVIMDISLPDGTGVDCTRQLKDLMPVLEVLMFTDHHDSGSIFSAFEAGASGYVLKRAGPDAIIHALREIMSGGVPMTAEVARKVVASFHKNNIKTIFNLTAREQTVLGRLAQGLSDKEIAHALLIAPGTVALHLKQIYRKLSVRSRTQAIVEYLKRSS